MTRGPLFHEQTARQRVAAIVDAGSFAELLPPPERLTSPYLAQLGIPVSFDDGVVIGRARIGGKKVYLAAQVGQAALVSYPMTVVLINKHLTRNVPKPSTQRY